MVPRPQLLLASALFALLLPLEARADDLGRVETGSAAYESNRFDECVQVLEPLLIVGSPEEMKASDLKSRARMLLAACLTAKKKVSEADAQMEAILDDDSEYAPNVSVFPSSLIGRFRELKKKHQEANDAKTRERLEREAKEREERELRERLEQERRALIDRMASEQVLITESSRVVALVPFGAGQFQNRQTSLGWALLGGEALLATSTIVTYLYKDSIAASYQPSVSDPVVARDRTAAATLINRISFGAFVGLAVGGIVHAQLTFVPAFRETRERALPPPVSAEAMPGGGMVTWQGSF